MSSPWFPLSPHSLSLKMGANNPKGLLGVQQELWLPYDNNLLDASGNDRHQTANIQNGPLAFTTDRVNGTHASDWDAGATQYIDTGVTSFGGCNLFSDATHPFSVAVWVNNNDPTGGIGMVISRRMSGTGFRLQVINDGANVVLRGQLSNYTITGNDDGEWHHYAVTWNGTAGAFYYDGAAQVAPINGTDTEGTDNILIGTVDAIGGGNPANFALFFDELMDDLRLWSRALSALEIAGLAGA